MRAVVVVTIVVTVVGSVSGAANYCESNLCPNGLKHIGCGNSGEFYASCPKDRRLVELTEPDIQLILNNHNKLRNKIASGAEKGFKPASRMATMTWNTELAELAALNVKQCKMSHDQCRSTKEFKYAGQNLAYRANGGAFEPLQSFMEKVIENWYDEVANAEQSDIDKCCSPKSGKTIGHFTQVITDRAIQVGCAVARYTEKDWKTSLMACNYAFTNLVGAKVYVSGKPASACSSGINPDFEALCSKNEKIKAEL